MRILLIAPLASALLLASCDSKQQAATPAPAAPAATAGLPATLFLTSAPDKVEALKAVKGTCKQGDQVTVTGRIGGLKDPFIAGRAVFTLMDVSLPTCSDDPKDTCKTPWDNCCEDPGDIAGNAATIQVVDASGSPMKVGLAGAGGLKPGVKVEVVGTVFVRDDKGTLVINATGLHVVN